MAKIKDPTPLTLDHKFFAEAKRYLVGGVNSPVRSFKDVGGAPVFIKSARGSKLYSEDGREFIDYCMAFGPLILGHGHPEVAGAIKEALNNGTVFGAPTKSETMLAAAISNAIPSIERLRFTTSGTEAVMTAIRLARAYTGKEKLIRFTGSYHGHADYLLDCHGVPEGFKKHTLTAPYNDLEKTSALAERYKGNAAAVIVEPVAGNMGLVLPGRNFLKGLREICDRYKIILIFDEVITGFRLCYGGAQNLFNAVPDMTCLGKIIGGGLPAGAVGGHREIMKLLAPEEEVYQAGTFSGNPLTINAGLETLKILLKDDPYGRLEDLTTRLCEGIAEQVKIRGIKLKVNFIASMFSISCGAKLFRKLYHALLEEGVYLSPSNLETNFISTAHDDKDIDKTLKAFNKVLIPNVETS
ncbi:MAG: glutamate-1-semialdehyde 2,1-aminomutase [Candidatus Omnitrophica bacterium]|nr:glutamate-1-semialdehyde 2,1-aminomutase [Candidatus Omnitrophota bacterium]